MVYLQKFLPPEVRTSKSASTGALVELQTTLSDSRRLVVYLLGVFKRSKIVHAASFSSEYRRFWRPPFARSQSGPGGLEAVHNREGNQTPRCRRNTSGFPASRCMTVLSTATPELLDRCLIAPCDRSSSAEGEPETDRVRDGKVRRLEGNLPLHRLVVLEFPTLEAAQRFYDSAEYQPILKLEARAPWAEPEI
jgi:hypothetical protein